MKFNIIKLQNNIFSKMKDHISYALNLSSWDNKAWKKNPMTPAIPVQCSYQLSYQATEWPATSCFDNHRLVRAMHWYRSSHEF